jgi:hypothetical protein
MPRAITETVIGCAYRRRHAQQLRREVLVTVLVAALLFLSSYSPLLGVFALLDTFGPGAPSIVCAVLAVLGAALAPVLFFVDRATTPHTLEVARATPRDSDVLAYIASYLVPFATVDAHSGRQQAAVAIFMVLVAVLYVRMQLFYINPVLALLGYRIYQVDTAAGTPVTLLCRRRFVPPGTDVYAVRLGEYVWREKRP